MRRIFLASEAMSIKIPDKIETILINIHQRLRANPPHASPRLARHQTRAGATRWGPQFWHWYCGEYTIYAANTETVQTSERLLLTNLPNMWRQLVSIPTSGSFQQLLNAFSDDCVFNIYHNVIVKTEELAQYQMRMAGAWSARTHGSLDVEYGMKDGKIRIQGLETWHLTSKSLSSSPAHECEISSETILSLYSVCSGLMHDSPSCGLGIKILFYPRNCQFGDGWI